MKIVLRCLVLLFIVGSIPTQAQFFDNSAEEERMFYAHTKQVNQFFRRFNGEEDAYGDRFSINDSLYQNHFYRKQFIDHLFDQESYQIESLKKFQFIEEVTNIENPKLLDFHGGEWVAEVKTIFEYEGIDYYCTFFMNIQEEEVGSKWVINRIIFDPYDVYFEKFDSIPEDQKRFLHPLSHELDFMNLFKVFEPGSLVEQFADQNYYPDHLSVFIYEFRKGLLKFKSIDQVKFHFFQIDGWYFELAKFNRNSSNSGWLISNLLKISEEDRRILKSFIYQQ